MDSHTIATSLTFCDIARVRLTHSNETRQVQATFVSCLGNCSGPYTGKACFPPFVVVEVLEVDAHSGGVRVIQ